MTRDRRRLDEGLPDEALERIDRTCLEFEAAWKEGKRPSIEQHVSGPSALEPVPGPERSCLLFELLLLDLDYRRRKGEAPAANEYRTRFPQDIQLVDDAFQLSPPARGRPMNVGAPDFHQAGGLAEKPAPEIAATVEHVPSPEPNGAVIGGAGSRIGPYKLLQEVGHGGMAVVYLAEQEEPVRRRVALKIIKPGMESSQFVARFEQERQALAVMDHPNIAKVFDAGTTAAGRPYFVMEFVKGIAITKYCDQEHLTPKERLELFIPICQAVQHAHQKGIIHRDLKPSNVLVALYDGKPTPKVIDFGLAKATAQRLTERTLFTEVGRIVGTLEYMAPEQAELNNLDIDTRADIYSLGVILYELLAGSPPFTPKQLRGAAYDEMMRLIREVEPPKPSTRISSSDELPSIAACRKLEPKRLAKLVSGELDWIAMKCLEKDRSRRYETANGLALDVQRYLADEPVLAGPPSAAYRLRKYARKHKKALVTAAAFALVLVLATVVSAWQAVLATIAEQQASEERDKAVEAEADATTQRDKALAAEKAAKDSEADTEAFGNFLVNDVLAVARPAGQEGGLGIDVTVRKALDAAAPKVAQTFAGRPRAEAQTRNAMGATYLYLGEAALAIQHLEKGVELSQAGFGRDHPNTLTSLNDLAMAYSAAGRLNEAVRLLEDVLNIRKASLPADHRDTLMSASNLAEAYLGAGRIREAIPLFEQTLKVRRAKWGGDDPDTLTSMNDLANAYRGAGRLNEAVALFEETLKLLEAKLGPGHPHTLLSMSNLATAYLDAKRADRALPLLEDALRRQKANLPPGHPDTLTTMNNLAGAYGAAGRLMDAVRLLEDTLKLQRAKLPPDHPDALATMNNLAAAYRASGRLGKAIELFEDTLKLTKAKLGPDHPDTLDTMKNLALAYLEAGRTEEGLRLFEETLNLMKAKLGPDHPQTLNSMNNLAVAYRDRGDFAKAEPFLIDLLNLRKRKLGADHPDTASAMAILGHNHLKQRKYAEAEAVLRQCLAIREKKEPQTWSASNARSMLGEALAGQKRYAEAEPLLRSGYEGLKAAEDKTPVPQRKRLLNDALQRLVDLHEAWGKPEQAAEWRKKLETEKPALQRDQKKQP